MRGFCIFRLVVLAQWLMCLYAARTLGDSEATADVLQRLACEAAPDVVADVRADVFWDRVWLAVHVLGATAMTWLLSRGDLSARRGKAVPR